MRWNPFHDPGPDPVDVGAARALGVASIGIGLAELAMPRRIGRMLGVDDAQSRGVVRAMGVRELMHGVDILGHEDPAPGVRARVAGDVLDGALLAAAGRKTRNPSGFMTALALVLPIVILDVLFASRLSSRRR